MTSIAKSTRVVLAVAVLALATAGAAAADVQHPVGAFHPNPAKWGSTGPAGSSWSSITPAGWKWAPDGRVARFHLTGSGCDPRCMI